jgi:hypothetical protein
MKPILHFNQDLHPEQAAAGGRVEGRPTGIAIPAF